MEEDVFTDSQKFIAEALEFDAMKLLPEGRVLKSRRKTPYFFDSGKFVEGKATTKLAEAYARVIAPLDFDALYGPPYKGALLVPSVAMALWTQFGLNREWSSSRKEVKEHGEGGVMLGASLKGKHILIVDDVITTGATKNEAVDLVHNQGGNVVGLVIGFDRMETAADSELSASQIFTKMHGVPVYSAADLNDLIAVLAEADASKYPPGILGKIRDYHRQYGTK